MVAKCQAKMQPHSRRLNIKMDWLSHRSQVISLEWLLHPQVANTIWQRWSKPHIALFATRENCKMPTFGSPFPDERAWATDALAIPWSGMWAYVFPPLPLIPKVLSKRREEMELVLVAPWWPVKWWIPELIELMLELPVQKKLLAHKNPGSSSYTLGDYCTGHRRCQILNKGGGQSC